MAFNLTKSINKHYELQFIVKLVAIYLLWTAMRESFEKIDVLNVHWLSVNDFLAEVWVRWSAFVCDKLFYPGLEYDSRNLFFMGGKVIYVGNHCIGIAPMVIYSLIILISKIGWKRKILFLFGGLIGVVSLNILRIVTLGYLLYIDNKFFFDLNHSFTYLLIIYGFMFIMILSFYKYKLNQKSQ